METIVIETEIHAPPQECFDAARDLDLHVESLAHTREKAVAGKTSGLIGMGEEVTWRGRHFGVYQHFTSRITAFDPPHYFRDAMQRGAFRTFVHDHFFISTSTHTTMRDVLVFAAPLGVPGRAVEKLVLRRYLHRLLTGRAAVIKAAAEARNYRIV